MLIRPELQVLRSNDAPQRSAQLALHTALQTWRTTGPGAQAEAELTRFHRGEPLDNLPLLYSLFCPADDGVRGFVDSLLHPLLCQLSSEPLGQSPLRFSTSDASSTVMLARCGTSALSLQHVSGACLQRGAAPRTAIFAPVETWERVLSGLLQATRVRLCKAWDDRADLECTPVSSATGDVRHRMGQSETLILQSAPTSAVQLRLQRRTSTCEPAREYDLTGGRLLHQAAGTPRDSRLELTASLLGRMKRVDAAPILAAMAEEQGSDSLRWQALRECLALDTAIGFRTLCTLAERRDDPLRPPAAALRSQLLQLHPQLNGVALCPA